MTSRSVYTTVASISAFYISVKIARRQEVKSSRIFTYFQVFLISFLYYVGVKLSNRYGVNPRVDIPTGAKILFNNT